MEVIQEQVGDLVLLGGVLRRSGIVECLDTHFPVHGNWQGPSVGQLTMGWLMYILSECDHRVSHVEAWAGRHLRVLRWALSYPELEAKHFQDDRLGLVLEYFSRDESWLSAQQQFNERLLRIYDLRTEVVRLDSAHATSFRPEDELFRYGARKKHQANLPQLKTMLAAMDPIGLPLSCLTVSGERADDNLYIETLQRARRSLPKQGLLYVGDSKLGNSANFAFIASSDNYYLSPLSKTQYSPDELRQSLEQLEDDPMEVLDAQGENTIALVSELKPRVRTYDQASGQAFSWLERLFLVRSPDQAKRQGKKLLKNIRQAKIKLAERFVPRQGRKIFRVGQEQKAQAFIQRTLKQFKVHKWLEVDLLAGVADAKQKQAPILKVAIRERTQAIQDAVRLMGWRAFATNAPASLLDGEKLIHCYRREYLIEQQFHRLLSKTTALLPIYLQKPNRIKALIRLLLPALQFSAMIQHQVRQRLKQTKKYLNDIIPGNPGRKVDRPTCKAMLKTFCGVAAVWVVLEPGQIRAQISHLRPVNIQILNLLGLAGDLYEQFALSFKDVKELNPDTSQEDMQSSTSDVPDT